MLTHCANDPVSESMLFNKIVQNQELLSSFSYHIALINCLEDCARIYKPQHQVEEFQRFFKMVKISHLFHPNILFTEVEKYLQDKKSTRMTILQRAGYALNLYIPTLEQYLIKAFVTLQKEYSYDNICKLEVKILKDLYQGDQSLILNLVTNHSELITLTKALSVVNSTAETILFKKMKLELDQCEQKNLTLTDQLQQALNRNDQLVQACQILKESAASFLYDNEKLTKSNNTLAAEIEQMRKKCDSLGKDNQDLLQKIAGLESDNQKQQRNLDHISRNQESLKENNNTLTNKNQILIQQNDEAARLNEELIATNLQLKNEQEILQSKINTFEASNQALTNELSILNWQNGNLKKENDDQKKAIKNLNIQLDDLLISNRTLHQEVILLKDRLKQLEEKRNNVNYESNFSLENPHAFFQSNDFKQLLQAEIRKVHETSSSRNAHS